MRRPANEPRPPKVGRLFQEDLLDRPFWMLVACQLVNLTTWDQAAPALGWLRRRYVRPAVLAAARPDDLHEALRPLGLWRRRATILVRFANAWLSSPPRNAEDVLKLPGCGKYASDTWAIFVDRRSDVQATDGKLLWFLEEQAKHVRPVPPRRGLQRRDTRHRGAGRG